MRRREFITLLGGATAAAWPIAARAQQRERMRLVGVLLAHLESDMQGQIAIKTLQESLRTMGWIDGRNVRFAIRWGQGNAARYRSYAAELVALAPDVIFANTSPVVAALQQATQTVPIVFAAVIDPVGAGFVANLARPGGNITGFSLFEYGTSGKWLALLKELAPNVTRVAVLRDPAFAAGIGQLAAIQAVAPSFGMELSPYDVRDHNEVERAVTAFALAPNGGVIVTASPASRDHRGRIIALVARHRLPAVYPFSYYTAAGALISYGPDQLSQFQPAAGYVDRILKGEKPADLPVQAPTKYELVINLKTAKALGIEIPPTLLARADEVIE